MRLRPHGRTAPASGAGARESDPGGSAAELRQIVLPESERAHDSPLRQVGRRLAVALALLVATALLVWFGRDGYHDNAHDHLDLLGAFYYATVSLSTTGYGDVTPVSDGARLTNILLITPLRVLFLIVLVGTTLEVLTTRGRRLWRINRWRQELDRHIVVVGYGTKGRNAVETLLQKGTPKASIVIVDPQRRAIETAANEDGLAGVVGDGTRTDVLRRAGVERAAQVVVAPQRDDTAVLVTLTVRQLNKEAVVVAAVREDENAPLLRQSGATVVVTSASSVGRLLGVSTLSPSTGAVLDDLLTAGHGLDVIDRPVTHEESGRSPRECGDLVVAVLRGHRRLAFGDPEAAVLQPEDRIIAIHRSS
ncbi:potassium channel family protein [Streptacidiphilus anmyonensis]|uniref:potassium channel family protein n=1 Tax=Streptacidiphilus anmyonensis TaxID=405782 RepID=UPI000A4555FE